MASRPVVRFDLVAVHLTRCDHFDDCSMLCDQLSFTQIVPAYTLKTISTSLPAHTLQPLVQAAGQQIASYRLPGPPARPAGLGANAAGRSALVPGRAGALAPAPHAPDAAATAAAAIRSANGGGGGSRVSEAAPVGKTSRWGAPLATGGAVAPGAPGGKSRAVTPSSSEGLAPPTTEEDEPGEM